MKQSIPTLTALTLLALPAYSATTFHFWDNDDGSDSLMNFSIASDAEETALGNISSANVLQFTLDGFFEPAGPAFPQTIAFEGGHDLGIIIDGGTKILVTQFTITNAGGLDVNFASNLNITTSQNYTFDGSAQFDFTKASLYGAQNFDETNFHSVELATTDNANKVSVAGVSLSDPTSAAVPEPSSSILIALSGLALLSRRRRS